VYESGDLKETSLHRLHAAKSQGVVCFDAARSTAMTITAIPPESTADVR